MSLLKTALLTEPDSRFTLFYGNRDSQLDHLPRGAGAAQEPFHGPAASPSFPCRRGRGVSTCSTACSTAPNATRSSSHLVDPAEVAAFFICGPGPMMDAAEEALLARGRRHGQDPSRALHRRPPARRRSQAQMQALSQEAAGPDHAGHPRRPQAPGRRSTPRPATSSTAPAPPACPRPSPARPESARPAGRGWSRARSRWRRATASPTRRWRRAMS